MRPLIIFDMDGVILNSEKLYLEMNQEWFREIGISLSIEDHRLFIGASARLFWNYIKATNRLNIDIEEYILKERELKHKVLQSEELSPTPGLRSFLEKLRARRYPCAIASSGLRMNIELILSKLKIAGYFDLVVSGEDIENGKPAPDIFLKVSSHFQQPPALCFVIEDSHNGVMAAKAAGMYCFGFINPDSGNQDLSKSDVTFTNFDDDQTLSRIEMHAAAINTTRCRRRPPSYMH